MRFCLLLLLPLLFDSLQGSTLPKVRKTRALNTTLQTKFNGTFESRNPCTNAEIERGTYVGCQEFHHHTSEGNWSEFTHRCSALFNGFLQTVGNLVRFNNKQNGLFNFHLNTSISQKQVGHPEQGKPPVPTILIEATDCQIIPRNHKNASEIECSNDPRENSASVGKFYGPVCLLNVGKKEFPRTGPVTISFTEQNAGDLIPKCQSPETENPQNGWIPSEPSTAVPNDISQSMNTAQKQIPQPCVIPTTPLPEPPLQVTTASEPQLKLEQPSECPATTSENIYQETDFNAAAPAPNMPYYGMQPTLNGYGTPSQTIVSVSNDEQNIQNQYPPAQLNEQTPPAVYTQQSPNDDFGGQLPTSPLTAPSPNSYPNQMTAFLPQNEPEKSFGDNPQEGALVNPPIPPVPSPSLPFNVQTPNPEFSANYPPSPVQSPPLSSSPELSPPDYINSQSEVPFTSIPGQVSVIPQQFQNNFVPDQQQTSTSSTETTQIENTTEPNEQMTYNQFPPTPSQGPLMKSVEVLPPVSVSSNGPLYPDSPVNPNEGVSDSSGFPVSSPFQPAIPTTFQPPITPDLTVSQDTPVEREPSITPPQYEQTEIPQFQPPLDCNDQTVSQIFDPAVASFPSQAGPNAFIQPGLGPVENMAPSVNFPEQKFDSPQQSDVAPIETISPQPSSGSDEEQFPNMFGPVPDNFQNIMPPQPTSSAPESDITKQAPEDSQLNFPTPEPSASGFGPNYIGNQLSDLTYNKPVINPNDFQPETDSYFTEPSDRNLDYTTQTPFYDSIPADDKSEPESQPDLISSAQNLSGERPIAPVPDQAFSTSGFEEFPVTPFRPEPLPPLTSNVTVTEKYSQDADSEFGSLPINPKFFNYVRSGPQMVTLGPSPQFTPQDQTFSDDRYSSAMEGPIPEIQNQFVGNQPPLDNNPVTPFDSNQNGDQQPLPEIPSQTSDQTLPENQPNQPYPLAPEESPAPVQEIQADNQLPNIPPYYPENRTPNEEFYPEQLRYENSFQVGPQSVLPYQPSGGQIPPSESQFLNSEITSPQSPPNSQINNIIGNENQPNIVPAAPETLSEGFPDAVEQTDKAVYDDSQIPQMNYPDSGFPNGQEQVEATIPPAPLPETFPEQSDSYLNYAPFQQNEGFPQPESPTPDNEEINSNSSPSDFPLETAPLNSQNSVNPNEFQATVPPDSPQPFAPALYPLPPLQNIPENSQVNNFPLNFPLQTTIPPESESLTKETDTLTLNPDEPLGVIQPEPQNLNTYNQFPPTVPPQFTSQSSDETESVNTDYPKPYQPQPSRDYYGEVPRVQTANQILTSTDGYQSPAAETDGPLNYSQEIPFQPEVAGESQPPPAIQSDQILAQPQTEFVQENPEMFSLNFGPRPQPQPSLDNLTEFPGDKTADSLTPSVPQTSLLSEIKPETFGSEPPSQTAFTETNTRGIEKTETLDTQPTPESFNYLGPQTYQNFDGPLPAGNYLPQDRPYFPQTDGSVTDNTGFDDLPYQRPNAPFTPYRDLTPPGINSAETTVNSNETSYLSTVMPLSEPFEMQPVQETSPFIGAVSPQPQADTAVKYNEEIPKQYQTSPAFNPQPQSALKYADQLSGDNVGEELPQFQQEMGQFDPQLSTFSVPNGGELVNDPRAMRPPQFDQQMQQPQPQTPPFSTYDGGETESESFDSSAPQVDQQVGQYQPQLPPFSEPNNGEDVPDTFVPPSQQFDQEIGQFQRQLPLFSAPSTEERLTETSTTSSSQFDQQMQPTPAPVQPFYGPNMGADVPDTLITPAPQFDEQIGQSETQNQPFPEQNSSEDVNDSFPSQPQQFDQQIEQYQPQSPAFSGPNVGVPVSFQGSVAQFGPQMQQSQQQVPPFSTEDREQLESESFVTPAPQFEQPMEQPQSEIPPFSGPNGGVPVSFPGSAVQFGPQMQQSQPQVPPFSTEEGRQFQGESFTTPAPQFGQPIEQPQPEIPPFSEPNREEARTESFPNIVAQFGPQMQQTQQQVPSFSTEDREQLESESFVTPAPQFEQPMEQPQPVIPPFSGPNGGVPVSFPGSAVQFGPQMQQSQPRVPPFSTEERGQFESESFTTPAPQFGQPIEQPQPEIPPFSEPNREEARTESFPNIVAQFGPQMQQTQQQVPSFSTEDREQLESESFVTPAPQFEQPMEQPQPVIPPFSGPNGGVPVSFPGSAVQFGPQMQQSQPRVPPFSTEERGQFESESFVTPVPQFEQPMEQPQPEIPPFSAPIGEEPVTESFGTSETQTDEQTQQLQAPSLPFIGQFMGGLANGRYAPQFDQQMEQPQQEAPPLSTEDERSVGTDSFTTPAPQFEQPAVEYQPPLPPFSGPYGGEILTETSANTDSEFDQQTQPPPTQVEPFYGPNMIGDENGSFANPPPQFEQQMEQPQPEISAFPEPNREGAVPESFTYPQVDQQIGQYQSQLPPLSMPNTGEFVTETSASSDFLVQPPFSEPNRAENIPETFVTLPPQIGQQMEQLQPQIPPFTTANREQVETEPFADTALDGQQEQFQSELPPFSGPNVGVPVSFPGSAVQFGPQIQQSQQQLPPFSTEDSGQFESESFATPAPPSEQPMEQPQTELEPFPGPTTEENVTESFAGQPPQYDQQIEQYQLQSPAFSGPNGGAPVSFQGSVAQFGPQMQQSQQQVPPFSTEDREQLESESFVTPAPQFEQPMEQPQSEIPPFSGPNGGVPVSFPGSAVQFGPQMQQSQQQVPPFSTEDREQLESESFVTPAPQFEQPMEQPQTEIPPFSAPIGEEPVTESFGTSETQTDEQTQQLQAPSLPFIGQFMGGLASGRYAPQFDQQMKQPQQEAPPLSTEDERSVGTDSFTTAAPQFEQPPEEYQTPLPPFSGPNSGVDVNDSFESQPPQFEQPFTGPSESYGNSVSQVDQVGPYQPQFPPFATQNEGQAVTDGFVTPAPEFDQQMQQSETQLQPFPAPRPEIVSAPFAGSLSQFEQPMGQPQPQVSPFSATNTEVATDPFVTPAPQLDEPIGQPQTQLQPFPGPNRGEIIRKSYSPARWSTFPPMAGNWNSEQNFVNSQSSQPDAGVDMARDVMTAPRPDSLVPVSDPTDPSNGPGEEYVSCCDRCPRGRTPLSCPFDPINKGNMTAPSYYILISKLPFGEDKDEQFQVEKVFLGDGTPLNCTLSSGKTFPTSMYKPVPFRAVGTVKFEPKSDSA